jgi:hypothetical protein
MGPGLPFVLAGSIMKLLMSRADMPATDRPRGERYLLISKVQQ